MFGSHYILNPRARVLWALDRALGLARGSSSPSLVALAARVTATPAARVAALAEHPYLLMWSAVLANLTRHEAPIPDERLEEGLRAVDSDGEGLPRLTAPGPEGLTLVGDNPFVRVLIGDHPTPLAALDGGWAPRLAAGLALLARVSPEQHRRVLAHVRFVASFDAPPGLLQSLSAGEWPGFVLLRCINSAAHVADQLVHETSHQLLDATFARRPDLVAALRAAPSAYSPFFTQPRPFTKLIHGLVSYLEVLRCWRGILAARAWEDGLTAEVAQARHDHVEALCRDGARSLLAATSSSLWPSCHALLVEVSPLIDDVLGQVEPPSRRPMTALPPSSGGLGLMQIQEAELRLALAGHKVSRLSLSLDQGRALAVALAPSVVPLFSRQVLQSRREHLKGSFANLAEATFEYYQPPPGAFVYAYVGADPDEVRRAALADEEDEAGALLGIPPCCARFFAARWPDARAHHHGDLAALLLAEEGAPREPPPWQVNPFAMYFDAGLTWHFPCSWSCAATVETIDRRRAALQALAPDLAQRLAAGQRRPIVLSPTAGILAADPLGDHTLDLASATPLEDTAPLAALRAAGPLHLVDGTWRTSAGAPITDLLGPGATLLTWR